MNMKSAWAHTTLPTLSLVLLSYFVHIIVLSFNTDTSLPLSFHSDFISLFYYHPNEPFVYFRTIDLLAAFTSLYCALFTIFLLPLHCMILYTRLLHYLSPYSIILLYSLIHTQSEPHTASLTGLPYKIFLRKNRVQT